MTITQIGFICFVFIFSACAPTTAPEPAKPQTSPSTTRITKVSHTVNGMLEVMKLEVSGKEIIVSMEWRNYSSITDLEVPKWYGDMGTPPAKYVAKKLTISVDGKGVNIPVASYRYLASQWMNGVKHLGVYKSGKNLNVYINVGDGAEAWTASYIIDPTAGTLVSHKVYDGPAFHNEFY